MPPVASSGGTGPEPSLLLLLARAARRWQGELETEVRRLDLSVPQVLALEAADQEPSLSVAELARRCRVTPAAMHSTVDALRLRGLVSTAIASDRRSRDVRVTAEGRQSLNRARTAIRAVETRVLQHLATEEVDGLRVGLMLLDGSAGAGARSPVRRHRDA